MWPTKSLCAGGEICLPNGVIGRRGIAYRKDYLELPKLKLLNTLCIYFLCVCVFTRHIAFICRQQVHTGQCGGGTITGDIRLSISVLHSLQLKCVIIIKLRVFPFRYASSTYVCRVRSGLDWQQRRLNLLLHSASQLAKKCKVQPRPKNNCVQASSGGRVAQFPAQFLVA